MIGSAARTAQDAIDRADHRIANEGDRDVEPVRAGLITNAKFESIREGMFFAQVIEIVGSAIGETSSSKFGNIMTKMCSWKSNGFGNTSIMFQNDRLVSKSQFGLK